MKPILFINLFVLFLLGCSPKNQIIQPDPTSFKLQNPLIEKENWKGNDFNYYRDYRDIKAATQDTNSTIHIDKLIIKFNALNEPISLKEKVCLLVGGTALKGYLDERLLILNRQADSLMRLKQYEKAIKVADSCLTIFPLDVAAILDKWSSYGELKDSIKERHYYGQSAVLFTGIMHSGGIKKEAPMILLSEECLYGYTALWASGGGYRFVEEYTDQEGNWVRGYEALGLTDYFLIPPKERPK